MATNKKPTPLPRPVPAISIEQAANGKWVVKSAGEVVSPELDSNAAAWRWLDRNEVHPTWMRRRTADHLGAWAAPETGGGK